MKRQIRWLFLFATLTAPVNAQQRPADEMSVPLLRHIQQYPVATNAVHRPLALQTQLDSLITTDSVSTRMYGYYYGYDNAHRSQWEQHLDFLTGSSDTLFYQYDAAGNITYSENDHFDASHTITAREIHTYAYDAQQHLIRQVDSSFSGGIWDASRYLYSQFNGNGKPQRAIQQDYDASQGQYVNVLRGDITYDSQSRITQIIIYQWDDGSSSWNNYAKLVRTFDSQGRMTQELLKVWATITWYDFDKKDINISTSGGNEIHTIVHQTRNGADWENVEKDIYEFDGGTGKIVRTEHYEWDDSASQWVGTNKDVTTYTASGNALHMQTDRFAWDSTAAAWKTQADSRRIYQYDTSISGDEIAWPGSFDSFDYQERLFGNPWLRYYQPLNDNKLLYSEVYRYDTAGATWIFESRDDLYYGPLLNVTQQTLTGLRILPNPFSRNLRFDWDASAGTKARLQIFDLTGKPVWSGEIRRGQLLRLSELTPGMYVFRLHTGQGTATGKLIKK